MSSVCRVRIVEQPGGVPALDSSSVVHTAPVTNIAFGVAGQAYPKAVFSARIRTLSTRALAMVNTIAVSHAE